LEQKRKKKGKGEGDKSEGTGLKKSEDFNRVGGCESKYATWGAKPRDLETPP